MKEQNRKKIENQAKTFKSRANKSPDDKRHDRIQQDEQKCMWIARNQLGWSFAKISSVFNRDQRTVTKVISTYKPEEGEKLEAKKPPSRAEVLGADQEKYRDHWGKLAKLAGELALCLEFRSVSAMLVPILVGRLPVPGKVVDTQTYPKLLSYPDEPGGCLFNYRGVSFSAEKSPLYEPLMEHLGVEFPKWREELQRAREVAAGWFKSNEEARWHLVADDESIRELRTRLYLSSERGIFYGKCPICKDWG